VYILNEVSVARSLRAPAAGTKIGRKFLSLSISSEVRDDSIVVHVGGDLDVYTAPRLKEELDEAVQTGGRPVLDLKAVQFIDSTALSVLVGAHQQAGADGRDLRLVVDDPYLLKIFRITGFDGIFSIFPEIEDALAAG
jgi:anti-sigma B factor antagonist